LRPVHRTPRGSRAEPPDLDPTIPEAATRSELGVAAKL